MLRDLLTSINSEEGHAGAGIASLVAAVGAVMLGIGAAGDDMGWLAIAGGIVLAVGVVAAGTLEHMQVDYDIFGRLEKLEGKK
jgi:hypothetical protein